MKPPYSEIALFEFALFEDLLYLVRSLTTIDLYVGEPELRLELDDKQW